MLIGATGLVGGHVLDLLLASSRYDKVVCLVRRPLTSENTKLTTVIVDFEKPETFAGVCAVDDLFCTFGTTMAKAGSETTFRKIDLEIPLAVVRACADRGLKQLIHVSSTGADPKSRFF